MGNSLPHKCHEAKVAPKGRTRPRRRQAPPGSVVPVDAPDAEEAGGEGGVAAVRVKLVMKKRDAAQLVARLAERGARQRKARMEELKGELGARRRGGGGGGGGGASPCRDAWASRLASIPEN